MAGVLAEAFEDDPVMHWMEPRPARLSAVLLRLFTAQLRHEYLPAGGVQMITDPAGRPLAAAMWKPPENTGAGASRGQQLVMAAAMVAALRSRLPAALALRRALSGAHPAEPHWYLNKLGTVPGARGRGLASALLTARLRECDATGTPAYLEATRPHLIGFYGTFGFTFTVPIDVSPEGPRVWGMWRAAR